MSEQQEQPDKHTGWYTFARVFGAVVTHTLCPVTFVHPERAQIDAPFIAGSNHNSWFDPVAIGYLIKRYETIFLGKKELTANPIMPTRYAMLTSTISGWAFANLNPSYSGSAVPPHP